VRETSNENPKLSNNTPRSSNDGVRVLQMNVFCDNQGVVLNTSVPSSTLKKKHNAIAYHRVREAVAANTIRVTKVSSEKNVADLLTKPLPGPKLHAFAQKILY